MTWKIVGIIIPLLVILFVLFVGIFDIGITKNIYLTKTVRNSEIVSNNSSSYKLPGPTILTIEVTNNFIFTRNIPIFYLICAKDKNDRWERLDYSIYIDGKKIEGYRYSYTYLVVRYGYASLIEVKPYETKKIELKLRKIYDYRPSNERRGFKEILLFEGRKQLTKSCQELVAEKNKALKIDVVD